MIEYTFLALAIAALLLLACLIFVIVIGFDHIGDFAERIAQTLEEMNSMVRVPCLRCNGGGTDPERVKLEDSECEQCDGDGFVFR